MKANNHMISFEKKKKNTQYFPEKNPFKWNFYLPFMIN